MGRHAWFLAPLAFVLLALQARPAYAGPLNVACEVLTGIDYCTECSGPQKRCFLCHRSRAPVWGANGAVTRCKPTTTGNVCKKASGDNNCQRCDGIWCVQCRNGFAFNANFRCVNAAKNCALRSGNPRCAACNPDGTCTRCKNNNHRLMPLNSIYINAGFPQTQCVPLQKLHEEAKSITWNKAGLTLGCREVDTEFKCNRCNDNQSLTNGKCVALAQGSKCSKNLPYYQYCAKCANNNPMRCIQCNGDRGLANGRCALPCRMIYGIGCRNCNNKKCLARDPAYANGR